MTLSSSLLATSRKSYEEPRPPRCLVRRRPPVQSPVVRRGSKRLPGCLLDYNTIDSALAGGTVDNGTWVGTTSYGAGQFGTGLVLNGSNYISIPSSADVDRTAGDLTVSACFNHLNSQEVS